jgi:divalent metal cation (Fe/Co/Zn/Cd) transporter
MTDNARRKERAALWSIAASAVITLGKGAAGFGHRFARADLGRSP